MKLLINSKYLLGVDQQLICLKSSSFTSVSTCTPFYFLQQKWPLPFNHYKEISFNKIFSKFQLIVWNIYSTNRHLMLIPKILSNFLFLCLVYIAQRNRHSKTALVWWIYKLSTNFNQKGTCFICPTKCSLECNIYIFISRTCTQCRNDLLYTSLFNYLSVSN